MKLRAAFQMDPIERFVIRGDSTFALMLEAQRRGHELFYYQPDELMMRNSEVGAHMRPVQFFDDEGKHYALGERGLHPLKDFDTVMLRQAPLRYVLHHDDPSARGGQFGCAGRQ
jgi:glutathione synthase